MGKVEHITENVWVSDLHSTMTRADRDRLRGIEREREIERVSCKQAANSNCDDDNDGNSYGAKNKGILRLETIVKRRSFETCQSQLFSRALTRSTSEQLFLIRLTEQGLHVCFHSHKKKYYTEFGAAQCVQSRLALTCYRPKATTLNGAESPNQHHKR